MPTQDKHPSHTRSTGQNNPTTHQFINSPTKKNKRPPAHQLKKSKHLQLINLKTHQLKNLNHCLLFYNTALIFAPFQREYRLKSREISTISNLSRLPVCLFLSKGPAFCTILPFQFGCQLVFFQLQFSTFSPQNPTF